MRRTPGRNGYTLIETIVAVLLFSLGGLALASTSAVIGRGLNADAIRERATRVAASRLEIISAQCRTAVSGRETIQEIDSEWSVSFSVPSRLRVVESVSFINAKGRRTDFYRAVLPCPE
jgi:prepilin-type N-terminal cleavage/methylation domain-containing protein